MNKNCYIGKSCRLTSSASETVYTTPLEVIFSDLWGPSYTSHSVYTYFVSLLKSKSETLKGSLEKAVLLSVINLVLVV